MPKIFKLIDITKLQKEAQKDYFDRHSPIIICDDDANEGEKFKVKIRIGSEYNHPDDGDHFIGFIQLWNRETLLAEVKMFPGTMGSTAGQPEIDFYVVPKISMNLTAMSYCTRHGLWQSEPKEVTVIKKSDNS